MSPLTPRDWSEGNAALDRAVAGMEEHFDALASQYERLEAEKAQQRERTSQAIDGIFRPKESQEEEEEEGEGQA